MESEQGSIRNIFAFFTKKKDNQEKIWDKNNDDLILIKLYKIFDFNSKEECRNFLINILQIKHNNNIVLNAKQLFDDKNMEVCIEYVNDNELEAFSIADKILKLYQSCCE